MNNINYYLDINVCKISKYYLILYYTNEILCKKNLKTFSLFYELVHFKFDFQYNVSNHFFFFFNTERLN